VNRALAAGPAGKNCASGRAAYGISRVRLCETYAAGLEPVERGGSNVTTASGGNCINMLLVGENQQNVLRLGLTAPAFGKNTLWQSAIG